MTGADVLARLSEWGTVSLRDGRIEAEADTPPPDGLRVLVDKHRDNLKAAILLAAPPAWLERLFDLCWSGHKTPVRMTTPKNAPTQAQLDLGGEPEEPALPYPQNLRGGKTDVYMVSVSSKNIAAAVAAEIGAPVLEWERIRPEVEEVLGTWKGSA